MTENLFTTDKIRTHSGLYLDVFNPDPACIVIEDIAHALAHQCRWGGHCQVFYSIAQHSVEVMQILSNRGREERLSALMHDASEAYLCDIPRPIKKRLPEYRELENKLMAVIAAKFGFQFPVTTRVKRADQIILKSEWDSVVVFGREFTVWSPAGAKRKFLTEFNKLTS
jgi:uncharacterized protein